MAYYKNKIYMHTLVKYVAIRTLEKSKESKELNID